MGHRICQTSVELVPGHQWTSQDGGTSTRPTQTADTAATSQHEAVVLQLDVVQLSHCTSGQGMPGTAQEPRPGVSWDWAGLGPAGRAQQEGAGWAGAQALRLLPGSGGGGGNGHTASWVLCKEGEEHRPYSSCSGSWRAASSQRGGRHGRPWLHAGLSSSPAQAELGCCPLPGVSSL